MASTGSRITYVALSFLRHLHQHFNIQAFHVYVRVSKVLKVRVSKLVVSQQRSPSRPGSVPSLVEVRSSLGMIFGGMVAPAPHW